MMSLILVFIFSSQGAYALLVLNKAYIKNTKNNFLSQTKTPLTAVFLFWCPRWESNPHEDKPHNILSVARIPFRHSGIFSTLRHGRELHPRIGVLQTPALLLGYRAVYKYLNLLFLFFQLGKQFLYPTGLALNSIFHKNNLWNWAHL